jgi:hypothetical protein
MTEQLMTEQLLGSPPQAAEPEPGPAGWRGFVFLLVLLTGLAVGTILVVALVVPSAGAAGGCGGG